MKKLISILLVLALAAALLTVSAAAVSDETIDMTGGWSAAESPEITEDIQALLDKALENLIGVDYVPVAYLGSQVVAGTNHCILCQAKAVAPNAEPYFALVYIYEDLSGGAEILDIKTLDLGEMLYDDEIEDGQNPVMNFVGEYQCGRAHALVECLGDIGAVITIEWGSSAWETAQWVIMGELDTDTLTIEYSDCVKSVITYDDGGESASEKTEYDNGTGTIVFNDDGTFTWHEDQSESGEYMVFEWLPVDYAQVANPWREITENEAKEIIPVSFAVPEDAEYVVWYAMDDEADPSATLVEVSFDLYGMTFTAREQVTNDAEADISGMYYDWTYESELNLKNWGEAITCKSYRSIDDCGYADLCTWYDAETGISYSVCVVDDDLDGFDLQAVAESMAPAYIESK